ncbi:MAG: HNH endonuclease [Clostridia bacterium]|nr:HNH endonuclease [Clostridia bacterium]
MKHFAIEERNLEFKNLLSAPAPVGRILNYIFEAGSGKLFHKNGYRSLDFSERIGYAWTTEFMIGLELVYKGSDVADKTELLLSDRGKRIYALLSRNYTRFSEKTDAKGIASVTREIHDCHSDLYDELLRLFVTSVPFQILREFLNEKGFLYYDPEIFKDDFFECVKTEYSDEAAPLNRDSRTPTSRNRVPSLLQLCELFGMLTYEGQTLRFWPQKINIAASEMAYSEREVQKAIEKDGAVLLDFDAVLRKYGIEGTVLVEAVVRNGALQKMFKHNLMVGQCRRCAVCGMETPDLLVGSHIKPAAQSNAAEKANSNNGLLLCCNHDKLFDRHLITFDTTDGKIKISKSISDADKTRLGLSAEVQLDIRLLNAERAAYLSLHNMEFERLEANRRPT